MRDQATNPFYSKRQLICCLGVLATLSVKSDYVLQARWKVVVGNDHPGLTSHLHMQSRKNRDNFCDLVYGVNVQVTSEHRAVSQHSEFVIYVTLPTGKKAILLPYMKICEMCKLYTTTPLICFLLPRLMSRQIHTAMNVSAVMEVAAIHISL
jgi:hypothetical protein